MPNSKRKPPSKVERPFIYPTKHSTYFLNTMTETRVTNYFIVVADTTSILKGSTERICDSIGKWKAHNSEDNVLLKTPSSDQLTVFGSNVVRIGELLGGQQGQDPITFWSNAQIKSVYISIIQLAKDVVKLKRKLIRISDGLMPDLKELKKLAEFHGLNVNNLDQKLESAQDFDESNTSSSILEYASKTLVNSKDKCLAFLRAMFSSKSKSGGQSENTKKTRVKSTKSPSNSISEELEIKTPSEKPSEKHLKAIASTLATPKNFSSINYILDPQDAKVKVVYPHKIVGQLKKFEKEMEVNESLTECNFTKKLNNSFKRAISPLVTTEMRDEEVKSLFESEARKYFPSNEESVEDTANFMKFFKNVEDNKNEIRGEESGNQNEQDSGQKLGESLSECERKLISLGVTLASDSDDVNVTRLEWDMDQEPSERELRGQKCKMLIDEMHTSVLEVTDDIRDVERSWLATSTRAVGFKSFMKLGDMLDYIRRTVELLDDKEFLEQVYPRTKVDILQALDTVYREFHSCFIALGELAQIVGTDVLYLKELMENLPKGDPIVYEFASNSSLGSFDTIANAVEIPGGKIPDLDAIFG